ncbi:translation initiation factor IF-2 [Drosophila grimshawi]|uniref:GH13386 n=1 Tax=Drosophila grimshawi TaxID=7222 RepID=B4JPJ7_DROGR|nr:translation initiation factor IF-2 [Drosophila grimshawi]EDV98827.1 GH13386 [Drosophila grimshawi]
MQATSLNAAPAAAATGAAGDAIAMPLRACSISGCQVSKYVEVTKRKCSQFVSAPYIIPKPLVINGKTSIFQVGGEMAKLGDIPALSAASGAGAGSNGQPIYRIKPGTHAHVINYVFIDEGSDSMEKAKSEDPQAMRVLLDSQRDSAIAKLQKLIATHRGLAVAAAAPAPAAPATAQNTAAVTVTTTAPASASVTATAAAATVTATPTPTPTPASLAATPEGSSVNITTPQIHPNLSIASVAGALPLAAAATPASAPAPTQPASTPTQAAVSDPAPAEENSIDQLRTKIINARRSVARVCGRPIP